ncbi:MAG: nuclear transport factor 2 family protein, partial [Methylococcales bacterium]
MIKQALSELIKDHFEAVEAKDLDTVLDYYHTEAEFLDPHYPNVHMQGKDEIRKGLTWGFKSVKTFSFTAENYFENEDKSSAAI